ncbi:protoporphyrinogen oxidase [Prevotella sp. HUN102]|uniref:protoporphyrinogen oxidase n=1 Tax=Prevotella sp. HUN102 TaxID=1392486 RepID=UPI00048E63BF|nr:protoporphyrinogen oxidase [Prevotella sp. HUN102]
MQQTREIIVIGAGLTGLTCARQLKKNGHDVEVLEKTGRIGGFMQTIEADGFVMEEGPSTGTIKHPEVAELFDDLADACQLEEAHKSSKCRLIWKGNQFHALPSNPVGAIFTPLFTLKDKFRILGEPWRKPGTNPNESVGALAERRLGKSFVDYAVDPFLSGVYAGDPYKLPTRLALPKLYNLEQTYGGFIRGSIALSKKQKTEREKRATKAVFSTRGGFGNLVQALGNAIGSERISLNCDGLTITPFGNKWKLTWGEEERIADEIITTCPSYELPKLLPFLSEEQTKNLDNLYYAPVIEIGVGIRDTKGTDWKAFGGLVPSKEKQQILGILMPSACFANRAPEGGANFAYFLGGARHTEYLEKSDEELTQIVNESLHRMLKFPEGTKADVIRIFRHARAIPQYMEETDTRLGTIQEVETQYPSLHIAGNIRDGIGMGDRIKQAVDVANSISKR